MKILMIQTAFVGDVVLATPIIEKLHEKYPEAQIDFLLKKGNESILYNHPYLTKVLVFDKGNKMRSLGKIIWQIRSESYDYVINLHRFFSSGLITALSSAIFKIGFDKNPLSFFYTFKVQHQIGEGWNEVKRNLSLVSKLCDTNEVRPKLYPSEADFANVKTTDDYICIAPASVWFTKQLPMHKWIELIESIDKKYIVYLLGASSDKILCEAIGERVKSHEIRIRAGALSFLESSALMKHATMNYVNDSAPMHFASAMNAPVTAIYCSTIPAFGFIPLSDQSFILQTNQPLTCRPCGLHGHHACPEGHFKCSEIKFEFPL